MSPCHIFGTGGLVQLEKKNKLSGSKVFPSGLVKDKLDQMSSHTSEDSATAQDEQMAHPR